MFLFLFFINFAAAQVELDYQLYTNSIGNEYNRVHFPLSENQTVWKLNSNCAFGPLITEGDSWNEFDIQYLPRADVSIEKYFGKGDVHPFVSLQTSAEVNVGVMPRKPILQATNVIAGVSIGPPDKFRLSAGVVKGTGFYAKQDATGLLASAGVSKKRFGVATSFVMENIKVSTSISKLSVGAYLAVNNTRYIVEYDKQFDELHSPAEVSFGIRHAREWNDRDVFLFSSFAKGTTSVPGSSPRVNVGITFSLQKNKPKKIEEEEEEDPLPEISSKEEIYILSGVQVPEKEESGEEPVAVIEGDTITTYVSDSRSITPEVVQKPKPVKPKDVIGVLDRRKGGKYPKISKATIKSTKQEATEMPDNTTDTVVAHEVQPSAVTPESLTAITQQTGGDTNLSMLLAILAVVGGGAAWKFYTQYSEQKHEQKMKELELQAKAAGLAGASPPPCQTAQAEMKAEIQALKTKVNSSAALLEDVDFDMYARKIKKIDKRLKALEDPDDNT